MKLESEEFIAFLAKANHPQLEEVVAQFRLYFLKLYPPEPEVKKVEFEEAIGRWESVEMPEPSAVVEPEVLEDIEESVVDARDEVPLPKAVKAVKAKKKGLKKKNKGK